MLRESTWLPARRTEHQALTASMDVASYRWTRALKKVCCTWRTKRCIWQKNTKPRQRSAVANVGNPGAAPAASAESAGECGALVSRG